MVPKMVNMMTRTMPTRPALLEQRTQTYWRVCQAWNGRSEKGPLGMSDALALLNCVILEIPSYHKLYTLASDLRDDLIDPTKKQTAKTSKI